MNRRRALEVLAQVWPWLAALSSGALLALCFAPWNCTALVWIALIPLAAAVWFSPPSARRPGLRAAALGYCAGVVFFTMTFHWLGALGTLFGQSILRGLPLLLALYMGLYFAIWAWFLARVLAPDPARRNFPNSWANLAAGALGASAWVALEWVRGWLFSGFGWNGLGVALHGDLPMIQVASLTGVGGLSWMVAFVNLMVVIILRRLAGEIGISFGKRVRWEFSISVCVVLAAWGYGVRSLLAKPRASLPLQVASLQPNIAQEIKFSGDGEDEVFQQLGGLTKLATAASPPDLLLWPESATPRGMYADEANYRFVMDHAEAGDFSLMLGTVEDAPTEGVSYNTAKLLSAHGRDQQTHRKVHLVPFGEYLPLRPLLEPIAGALVPGDFAAGTEATVLELPKPRIKLSALICFEDTLGDLTRRFVQNGAQVLVNLTNDGWFLRSAGAEQHLQNALLRAVENRRPLIRCTNTGMTCWIGPNGHIEHSMKPFQAGFATWTVKVPAEPALTFYTRHGDWVAKLSALLALLATGGSFLLRRSKP